jgi:hypothetical protein
VPLRSYQTPENIEEIKPKINYSFGDQTKTKHQKRTRNGNGKERAEKSEL